MAEKSNYRENLFVSLAANIAIPALILSKGADWVPQISPVARLVIALAFPCAYFVYDYVRTRKTNFISILGFAGTLLTGGVGLFRLAPIWVAVKEAAIPALIAIALLISRKTVRKFLFNERVFDVSAIESAVSERGTFDVFDLALRRSSWLLFLSFALSAVLNFALARWIVVSDPAENLDAFNAEIGKMLALSWPVIVAPCIVFAGAALFVLVRGITTASAIPLEKLLRADK